MNRNIFSTSFKESLNLVEDEFAGDFIIRNFNSAQETEHLRGKLFPELMLILSSIIFLIGPNLLIVLINNKFFAPVLKVNLLPYSLFYILLIIWLSIILLGRMIKEKFLLIYRQHFHMLITFFLWLTLEINLFL